MVMSINTYAGAYVAVRSVKPSKRARVVTPPADEQTPEDHSPAREPDDERRRNERHADADSGMPGNV